MQEQLTARKSVELFHLVFLRALFSELPDKRLVAVKGGINLRFYFHSVRFSEDIDLDVTTIAPGTLENKIDRLLASPKVVAPLAARGLAISDVGKPKQTGTAQKWKLGVTSAGAAHTERTKIEFSRRDALDTASYDAIDAAVANVYGLPTFLATHYQTADAVRQKVHALADRKETQPRDVFDLSLLLSRPDAPKKLDDEATEWIDAAVANAMTLGHADYSSLVVAYLDPEQADLYSPKEYWETMQLDVISKLEAMK